jgi:hypothetical protein
MGGDLMLCAARRMSKEEANGSGREAAERDSADHGREGRRLRAQELGLAATFGLACCAIELFQAGPRHDLARFGMERAAATPRQADLDDRGGPGQPEDGAGAAADL